jgi:hypothetical protein
MSTYNLWNTQQELLTKRMLHWMPISLDMLQMQNAYLEGGNRSHPKYGKPNTDPTWNFDFKTNLKVKIIKENYR